MEISEKLRRVSTAIGKVWNRVPLGGERVWPGLRNDLFVAHLSIYEFFARFCQGKRVLDVGCGLGYGTYLLAEAGSQEVLGIDIEARAIWFAKRRYKAPSLGFRVEDCQALDLPEESFDLIVSSNTMEHLEDPAKFMMRASTALRPGGAVLIAVPPITSEKLRADNEENPHHLSNLTIDQWLGLFLELGFEAKMYRHTHPTWRELDFSSFKESQFREADFLFQETDRRGLVAERTLTAVFLLSPVEANDHPS